MLELILQLFGGRGSGSGNKGGGHQAGVSAAGMTGTGKNGILTVSDLVKSGKTFDKEDPALYEKSGPTVQKIIEHLNTLKDKDRHVVDTVQFTHVNKESGDVTVKIGWTGGKVTEKTYHTKKKK